MKTVITLSLALVLFIMVKAEAALPTDPPSVPGRDTALFEAVGDGTGVVLPASTRFYFHFGTPGASFAAGRYGRPGYHHKFGYGGPHRFGYGKIYPYREWQDPFYRGFGRVPRQDFYSRYGHPYAPFSPYTPFGRGPYTPFGRGYYAW